MYKYVNVLKYLINANTLKQVISMLSKHILTLILTPIPYINIFKVIYKKLLKVFSYITLMQKGFIYKKKGKKMITMQHKPNCTQYVF